MKTNKVRLYGRLVPAEDYAKLKHIAGSLYGATPIGMSNDRAMRIAIQIAISALAEVRRQATIAA